MKQLLFIFCLCVMSTSMLLAQASAPSNQINLQAVARNTNGTILASRPITLKVSLLEGSATGSPVWVEQSSVTSNQFGILNYAIGSGAPVGSFTYSNVNWATKKFIKLEIDPAGGLNFVTLSTEELKSVPYANVATKALSLNLPLDITAPDNGPATITGLVVRSNIADGIAGLSTKQNRSGLFGHFVGDVNNTAGNGVLGHAAKDGNGVVGRNTDKGTIGMLGTPIYSGSFGGAPVLIENRNTGVQLQLAGADHSYIEFYPVQATSPATRKGYIGYPSPNNKSLAFINDYAGGENVYNCGVGGFHSFYNGNMYIKNGGTHFGGFTLDAQSVGLELHSLSANNGFPYIDFAKDPNRDFDMRLALEETNSLLLQGGQLRVASAKIHGSFSYAYLTNAATAVGRTTDGNFPVSIRAEQRIVASEFDAFSDKRIKKDFQISKTDKDLAALSKLEVTDYRHVDFVSKGTDYKKGFIAQQVEQFFPEAVSKSKDFIPNIYQSATKATVQNDVLRIDMAAAHGFVKGDKVRFYVKDKIHELEVSNTEGSSFSIHNWTHGEAKEVFVYGKEVNDFRTVDYDRIFTLNVSATQELIKRNKELEKRLADLEKQNNNLENNFKNLEGKVSSILKYINTEGGITAEAKPISSTSKITQDEK